MKFGSEVVQPVRYVGSRFFFLFFSFSSIFSLTVKGMIISIIR